MNRLCLALATLAIAAGGALGALAEGGGSLPAIDHRATLKECGDCHIPFPPQMLPVRSWRAITSDLKNHFGDNAVLPESTRADIEAYLVANAADAPGSDVGQRFLRGTPPGETPLRITETGYWKNAHEEVSDAVFADPKIKTRSNCAACHRNARQGQFGEVE
jgi:hypothetical protein